jgi:hypothetical protein
LKEYGMAKDNSGEFDIIGGILLTKTHIYWDNIIYA